MEQVVDDRRRRDQEHYRKYQLRQRIHQLKQQGMVTERLETAVEGDLQEAEKVFAEYEYNLSKLAGIWNKLYSIDFRGFESEYKEIYDRLRDPFAVADLEKMIATLEKAITDKRKKERKAWEEEQKKREEDLRRQNLEQVINAWKARGYDVTKLEEAMKRDLDEARKEVAQFEQDVRVLWGLSQRLDALDVRGFEEEYEEIKAMLFDIKNTEDATKRVEALEAKAKEKMAERKEEWTQQMEEKKKMEDLRHAEEQKKLQEEARKAAEAKRSAEAKKDEWARKLAEEQQAVAKAKLYLNRLTQDMMENHPEMSPLGFYLGDRKWSVEKRMERLEVEGKVATGFMKDHLFVQSRFMSASYMPTIKDMENYFAQKAKWAASNGFFVAECLIMNRVSEASEKLVAKFKHKNMAAFLYDIQSDELFYNKKETSACMYAGFFIIDQAPMSIREIIKPFEDEFEVFYEKDIVARMGMKEDEVKRMLKHLEDTNKIYPVEKRKRSFAFP
jgi:hypothetical protein